MGPCIGQTLCVSCVWLFVCSALRNFSVGCMPQWYLSLRRNPWVLPTSIVNIACHHRPHPRALVHLHLWNRSQVLLGLQFFLTIYMYSVTATESNREVILKSPHSWSSICCRLKQVTKFCILYPFTPKIRVPFLEVVPHDCVWQNILP